MSRGEGRSKVVMGDMRAIRWSRFAKDREFAAKSSAPILRRVNQPTVVIAARTRLKSPNYFPVRPEDLWVPVVDQRARSCWK
jgi:hypothetical protein